VEKHGVVQDAWSFIEPELIELGFELVEVDYIQDGASSILRFYIDKDGGVNVDHCAEASRMISALLDQKDLVGGKYMLEVSSPGIDRPVRKVADFERFTGEQIKLKTVTPILGRKRYSGVLVGINGDLIEIDVDGSIHSVHIENLKKAKLVR